MRRETEEEWRRVRRQAGRQYIRQNGTRRDYEMLAIWRTLAMALRRVRVAIEEKPSGRVRSRTRGGVMECWAA